MPQSSGKDPLSASTALSASAAPASRSGPLSGFPWWLLLGVSVILALVVAVLVWRSSHREEQIMEQAFRNRADALIWALEAGSRTWMGYQGDRELLQQLVEETAKQPGTNYLVVADTDGNIISHSDASKVGGEFPLDLPAGWEKDEDSRSRIRDIDGERVFEFRRLFAPISGDHHAYADYRGGHHGMGMGMGRGMGMGQGRMGMMRGRGGMAEEQRADGERRGGKTFIFVGLDQRPFAAALREDQLKNVVAALAVAGLALAGFVSMFWYYSHRRSRRLLMDARGLAREMVGELERLQGEVEKNRRLTALGNMAAGVAHEIRNPLSSIKGLAVFLAGRAKEGGAESDAARTIVGEVDRLGRVVSGMLDFARPDELKLAPGDVNGVVVSALRLAGADIAGKHIRVSFEPRSGLPEVMLNRERLTQALLNLFLNAVQAMDDGGMLGVKVEPAGDKVAVVIRDDGAGMNDDVRNSIFTPYFTTKPDGTGLGLAIVERIVEGHGGGVSVTSDPGAGSEFTILLPAIVKSGGKRGQDA